MRLKNRNRSSNLSCRKKNNREAQSFLLCAFLFTFSPTMMLDSPKFNQFLTHPSFIFIKKKAFPRLYRTIKNSMLARCIWYINKVICALKLSMMTLYFFTSLITRESFRPKKKKTDIECFRNFK